MVLHEQNSRFNKPWTTTESGVYINIRKSEKLRKQDVQMSMNRKEILF